MADVEAKKRQKEIDDMAVLQAMQGQSSSNERELPEVKRSRNMVEEAKPEIKAGVVPQPAVMVSSKAQIGNKGRRTRQLPMIDLEEIEKKFKENQNRAGRREEPSNDKNEK